MPGLASVNGSPGAVSTTNDTPELENVVAVPVTNGNHTNGTGSDREAQVVPISTAPAAAYDWRITLEGKVIVITGANRGIGLGVAEVCLANSASHIYSFDLSEPDPVEHAEFHDLAQKFPGRLHFQQCNVTDQTTIDTAIKTIISRHERFDGMIVNAGMTKHQPALNFSEAQIDQIFDLNLSGAYYSATAAARAFMRLRRPGSIVFTSSMTSYGPNRAAPSAPYGATKAAVRNLARTMAMEWALQGIRVNSVSPGFVSTQMTTYYVEKDKEEWDRKMKYYGGMGRLADPKELGGAYVYLLSDASSYTSGIDIPVAGVIGAW